MNSKTIVTAMVAMILVIGMTGLAMAGTTTQTWTGDGHYATQYSGAGTGDLSIYTYTSYGDDFIGVTWDGSVSGHQNMNTPAAGFTKINRVANVGTGVDGDAASGTIETMTTDNDNHYVYTFANYKDNAAYGSNVGLNQKVEIVDNGPDEALTGKVTIAGFAYGAVTNVFGQIEAGTIGVNMVRAIVDVDEGKFSMAMKTQSGDIGGSYLDEAKLSQMRTTATGTGSADLHASADDVSLNIHTTNDGLIDHFNGHQGTSFNQYDIFNNGYSARGYIYAVEI